MNVRNHSIEIQCTLREVTDVAQTLVHSLIFFRTHGKFNYKHEGSYSVGTLGYEKAHCDQIDLSYIRCSSPPLVNRINSKISELVDRLTENALYATLMLEFYTKRPSRWPFNDSKYVWELWNIKIVITQPSTNATTTYTSGSAANSPYTNEQFNHHQQSNGRYLESEVKTEDVLSQKLLDIIRIVNGDKCSLPQMPTQQNLSTVFDTSYSDLQPYLHNLSYKISENLNGSHLFVGSSSPRYSDATTVTDTSAQSTFKKFLLGTLEL